MFGSVTFRRILLSRILLLSVPVLLIGQFVTYRQVRLSLLAATHDRLMQSADRKGGDLSQFVAVLQSSASLAREALPAIADDPNERVAFLDRLSDEALESVACIWLESIETARVLASSCETVLPETPAYRPSDDDSGDRQLGPNDVTTRVFFAAARSDSSRRDDAVDRPRPAFALTPPPPPADRDSDAAPPLETLIQLDAPVPASDPDRPAQYVLRIASRLPDEYRSRADADRNLLRDATLIADGEGMILAYPLQGYVGRNLGDLSSYDRLLEMKTESAQEFAQRTTFVRDTFELDEQSRQAIVGYAKIFNPTRSQPASAADDDDDDDRWIVFAVADLDLVLRNLTGVRNVMLNLVLLLLAANLSATLFLARDLALPVERLGRYARSIECNTTPEALPSSFAIEEFNQLAAAMNASIERLKAWAMELSAAWQQARQSNQLKSEFLTTISHELRTPLNGIIGSLRLIRDDFCESRSEELEFLQRADDSAIHLLEIIDDILDISNIEAGTVTLLPESIDVRDIVRDAIEVQQHELKSKDLTLTCELGESSTTVYVDPSKLRRVLVNVIGNAVKFTEIGQIDIRVGVRSATASASRAAFARRAPCATIEVIDTGIGIDPRIRDRLFEPFVMSDGSTTRRFGGTGLGLAISRNLLEMMGGHITIDSLGIDRGATVTIEVPLATTARPHFDNTAPTSSPVSAPPQSHDADA